MSELNPNAQKWVEALRSGRFQQGRKALTLVQADGSELDCCLGVACKIAIENGVELETMLTKRDIPPTEEDKPSDTYEPRLLRAYGHLGGSSSPKNGTLPREVREWLGIASNDGRYGEHGAHVLTADNDSGKTFTEIADIIESNVETLFDASAVLQVKLV